MRKVLSFVLVLALVLGSFSFAFGLTDIDDSANKDAIQVCNDLGIIDGYPDGTFQGDKAVNRAEFAKMITVALGVPESALAGYATTSFKDVAGYGWAVPYLAFCESKGIMLGDGMGNAMPGRTISVNEAITMALRAIGYTENSAMLVGTWPSNYVTLGQQQGLYTSLATATTIDRANAAQVIYNALSVPLVSVNADGETTLVDPDGVGGVPQTTMLEAYLECKAKVKSVLGDTYGYDNSLINITGNLGAYGTPYTNDDGDLVAFKTDSKSVALTGKVNVDDRFVVGDTKYYLSKATGTAVVLNNATVSAPAVTFAESATGADTIITTSIAAIYSDDKETVTLNAEVSGNYILRVWSVVSWKANSAEMVGSDVQADIADGELLGFEFELDSDDEIITSSFQLLGASSLEDIEKDDVVAVYYDGTYIRKVTVGTDVVTGTVDEEGATFFVVNGTKYNMSKLTGAKTLNDLAVGDEGTFYLDYSGKVFDLDTTGATDAFGVITNYDAKAGTWGSDIIAKVYTQDDATKTYTFNDDYADVVTNSVLVTEGAVNAATLTAPALVAYALDDAGDLKVVDGRAKYASAASIKVMTEKVALIGGAYKNIAADVVVFVSDASVTAGYKIGSIADVAKGVDLTGPAVTTASAMAYLNDSGEVAALLLDDSALPSATEDYTFGVIDSVTDIKVGSDTVRKLVGWVDGVATTLTTTKDVTATVAALNTMREGNLMIFTPNTSGNITAVATPGSASFTAYDVLTLSVPGDSKVTRSGVDTTAKVITLNNGALVTYSTDIVVYKYDATAKTFTVTTVDKIGTGTLLAAYDTNKLIDGEATDMTVDVIVFK